MLIEVDSLFELVEPPIAYKYLLNPKRIRTLEQARQHGANCETMAHLGIYALFGERLHGSMRAYEIFRDDFLFETLKAHESIGDVAIFGPEDPATAAEFIPKYDQTGDLINWLNECPAQHVGLYTGETMAGDPLILDSSHVNGQSEIRTLSQITSYSNHAFVQRWARLAIQAS